MVRYTAHGNTSALGEAQHEVIARPCSELPERVAQAQAQPTQHTRCGHLRRLPSAISAMSHASSAALLAAAEGNLMTTGAASRSLAPPMFPPPVLSRASANTVKMPANLLTRKCSKHKASRCFLHRISSFAMCCYEN